MGGNHKVSMESLRKVFTTLGFQDVKTYINSGNVIFKSSLDNLVIKKELETVLADTYGFEIPVCIIDYNQLEFVINHAPKWWGEDDESIYDNTIFIMPPYSGVDIYEIVGEAHDEYEKIEVSQTVIYWSFPLKTHRKANWYKIHQTQANALVTIRTEETVKKLYDLMTLQK